MVKLKQPSRLANRGAGSLSGEPGSLLDVRTEGHGPAILSGKKSGANVPMKAAKGIGAGRKK